MIMRMDTSQILKQGTKANSSKPRRDDGVSLDKAQTVKADGE